jgi:hypothetical protein
MVSAWAEPLLASLQAEASVGSEPKDRENEALCRSTLEFAVRWLQGHGLLSSALVQQVALQP